MAKEKTYCISCGWELGIYSADECSNVSCEIWGVNQYYTQQQIKNKI